MVVDRRGPHRSGTPTAWPLAAYLMRSTAQGWIMPPPANDKVASTTEKRGRGRPRKPDAMAVAERQVVGRARHARMNAIPIRLLSLAHFAAFCATLTYWIVTLT